MNPSKKKRRRHGRNGRNALRRRAARRLAEQEALAATRASQAAQTPGSVPSATAPNATATGPSAGPEASKTPPQAHPGGPGSRGGAQAAPQGQNQPETALFERRDNVRSDANMVIRALRLGWLDKAPKPEATEAVMTKATMIALEPQAKPHEVIAVVKLHLEYQSRVLGHLHHEDRMDYYERALQVRSSVGGYNPGAKVNINTEGGSASVSIFLPAVEEIDETLLLPPIDEQQ